MTELTEKVENALQVTEDVYLARVYTAALELFRVSKLSAAVDRKLAIIRDTYSALYEEASSRRAELMELAIVLLIVFEIALALVRRWKPASSRRRYDATAAIAIACAHPVADPSQRPAGLAYAGRGDRFSSCWTRWRNGRLRRHYSTLRTRGAPLENDDLRSAGPDVLERSRIRAERSSRWPISPRTVRASPFCSPMARRVLHQGRQPVSDWWKLTPDITGSYINGTWSQMASLPAGYVPEDFASGVLDDGRVVIAGGEYNNGNFALTNLGAVYDPKKNTWTALAPPTGWKTIGDSPSVVLADGSFLLGQKLTQSVARLDPQTMTWTVLKSIGKHDFNSEEGWTLMPNGTILTADVKAAPKSEIYNLSTQAWTSAGSTIVDLHSPTTVTGCITYPGGCYYPPGEIGPQILRPDGTVFVTGGTPAGGTSGHTAVYHPTTNSWTRGPDFPDGDDTGDEGAVLLPGGNVLVGGESGNLYRIQRHHAHHRSLWVSGYPVLMLPSGRSTRRR